MAENPPQQPGETPEPNAGTPETTPPKPSEKREREAVVTQTKESLGALREQTFLKQFGEFITRIEKNNEWDFAGSDLHVAELRNNPVWITLQQNLKNTLIQELSEIPKDIPQNRIDEWLKEIFDRMAKIIASYDETSGTMTKEAVKLRLEEVLGKNGNPGKFMNWFERTHADKFKAREEKREAAKKTLADEKGKASGLLSGAQKNIPSALAAGLGIIATNIQKKIDEAVTPDEITGALGDIQALQQMAAEAGTTAGAIRHAEENLAKLPHVGEVISARVMEAKNQLGKAGTLAEIEAAHHFVETPDDWKKLDELLGDPDLPENEKALVKEAIKKPEFDPRTEVARLEPIRHQKAFEVAETSQSGVGTLGRFINFFRTPFTFFGRTFQIDPEKLSWLCVSVLAIVKTFNSLSPKWRRGIIGSGDLAFAAKLSGDQEWLEIARQEGVSEKILLRTGFSQATTEKLLDHTVSQIMQMPPQNLVPKEEIPALERLRRTLPKNAIPTDKTPLAVALGNKQDFKIEAAPQAVAEKPAEGGAENPEQKTVSFLKAQTGLTDDELTLVKPLSAAEIAKDKVVKPEKFDADRFAKVASLLKKNHAQDKDSGITVTAFLTQKFQANEPPKGLA